QLSIRDPKNKNKYLGSDEIWLRAEQKIKDAVTEKKVPFIVKEGEAAFYGPKLDFMIKDSLGREWQCGTIQIDFMLPERFKLEYTNSTGKKQRPVVIHRAIAGSLERFFAILVEHYAGAFPLWLAPVQVVILPVSDMYLDFAHRVLANLTKQGFRCEVNSENQTLGKKIRQSTLQKVPHMVIIGDREVEKSKDKDLYVSVRTRTGKDLGMMDIEIFIKKLQELIEKRAL
ncbi:threonine--tRNA ligase, partial [Candidatus Roizmanbacteria bacterium CG09_land_8_20_14_0_10_41_9]